MIITMDVKSAEMPPPSKGCDPLPVFPESESGEGHGLPPITSDTAMTPLQAEISRQSWDRVSARQPIGCRDQEPERDYFIDHASTILETRLADVVRQRKELSTGVGAGPGGAATATGNSPASATAPAVLLTSTCRSQLRAYVRRIASMYRGNRYHSLEHAVHVTMSANKLVDMLYKGATKGESDDDSANSFDDFAASDSFLLVRDDSTHSSVSENGYNTATAREMSEATSGFSRRNSLSGEPLARPRQHRRPLSQGGRGGPPPPPPPRPLHSDAFAKFALVFAAMVHDVDHKGVPNARLILEGDPDVALHGLVSTAEKRSIRVAFRTLSEDVFDELRAAAFATPDDRLRMHRLVTGMVLSTDIASGERMQSTKLRWEEAFCPPARPPRRSPGAFPAGGWVPPPSLPPGLHPPGLGRAASAGPRVLPLPISSEVATVQASEPRLVAMREPERPASGAMGHHPHWRHQRRSSLERSMQMNGGQTVEYFMMPGLEREEDDEEDGEKMILRRDVVLETMLNVADVAHSMQSWELFLFWNRRLFEELFVAYKEGRSDNDPSKGWYGNQLGFYRLYVIPLAEKMRKCGVFGELGGEWVKNAISIRDRWSQEGERITEDMITSVEREL
ncbi:hypothetical protein ACHAWF_007573 [Thalassiosira exigua]